MNASRKWFGLVFVLSFLYGERNLAMSEPIKDVEVPSITLEIDPREEMRIPDSEIPELELKAASGSWKSALRLASYYATIVRDSGCAMYWGSIAAESGDPGSMYSYANSLAKNYDVFSRARAVFWYKKVLKSGEQPFVKYAELDLKNYEINVVDPDPKSFVPQYTRACLKGR